MISSKNLVNLLVSSFVVKLASFLSSLLAEVIVQVPFAQELKIYCKKTVFPMFMQSTRLLITMMDKIHFTGSKVLDVGTGSGILAIYCAKNYNSKVFASDINPTAVKATKINAKLNNIELDVRHGDLFSPFSQETFNLILFNPPFFPSDPSNNLEQSIFTGQNYQVIKRFLSKASKHLSPSGNILLTLSSLMDLSFIEQLIHRHQLTQQKIGWTFGFPGERINAYLLSKDTSHGKK